MYAAAGGVWPAVSRHDPARVLSTRSPQGPSDRTLLGSRGKSLAWHLARRDGPRAPVCQDHDVERQTPRRRSGAHDLADGRHLDERCDGDRGPPPRKRLPDLGKWVVDIVSPLSAIRDT